MKAPLWLVLAALCLPTLPLAAQSPSSRVIECGTDSGQRVLCEAGGPVVSAKLVSDLSFNRCNAAGSWGWTGNALWTDNSCRGRFEVSYNAAADSAATRRITCGTLTTRRDQCSTEGVADSVRLVKLSTFARCREGSNWGYSDTLIWAGNGCRAEFEVVYRQDAPAPAPGPAKPLVRTISCGRTTGELYACELNGYADTVRLVRELSSKTCRQKYNWDYARTFVWARSGCRGIFEVTYGDTLTGAPPGTMPRRITCGSLSAAQVSCKTEGHAAEVRLVRDISGSRCREGSSWGHTETYIWTSRGCRGEFEVTFRSDTAPQMKPVTPAGRVVTCGNASGAAMSCNAFGTVATVRLQRDRSGGRCGQSSNWGLRDQAIWVTGGCYGDFEVTHTGTPK